MSNVTIDSSGNFVSGAPANKAELMQQANKLMTVAESYIVDSPEMRAMAIADVSDWKKRKAALEDQRLSVTRPLDQAKAALMAIFKAPTERLNEAINTVSGCILVYDAKMREEAAIERRRLEAIAEAERKRLEALAAEEKRKADEVVAEAARASAEEKRKADEAIAAAAAEDARLRQMAEAAARAGDMEAQREAQEAAQENMKKAQEAAFAAQIEREAQERAAAHANAEALARAQAAQAALSVTSSTIEVEVSAKGSRAAWKGRCNDKMALVRFIVSNPAYLNLVDVNASALNQLAKAQKDAMRIDGCTAYQDRTIVASRS